DRTRRRVILQGDIPSPLNPPPGCVFHTRCPIPIDECRLAMPELRAVHGPHAVACIRARGYGPTTGSPEAGRSPGSART
ncbi:MAG: peptide ABC transporter substrate-binding protein, partial [Gemmatimonadetes bacterium]|nr:peptide ABC transporter substrate-binding protein [Gemmatimonadota bacterium]